MVMVVVSPKFQIVIPKAVRKALGIAKGQKLEVFVSDDKLEVVPVPKLEDLAGKFPDLKKGPSLRKIRKGWDVRV
ncbi:MAG: AbrB/MazE/SpoVT family DNA-binding domain-containing protein [Candidatus Micrarchaeia archaeon]